MNHDEFIQKLLVLGFDIQVFAYEGTGFALYVNGLGFNSDQYKYFGYYCGGQYAPCSRTDKVSFDNNDLEDAIKSCSINIMKSYASLYNRPDYNDIIDLLYVYGKTKIEKDACKRVIDILADKFQDLCRNKKKFTQALSRY